VIARAEGLCDFLHIQKADKFSFSCPRAPSRIPQENNTVLKAVKLLQQVSGKKFQYKIVLKKHIPICSGFGGGSSDAAAILIYLKRAEKLKLTKKELMNLGAKIGMDVPFFVSGYDTAKCTHYGEKVTRLPALPKNLKITLVKTRTKISTRAAYKNWDRLNGLNRLNKKSHGESTTKITPILTAIKNRNAKEIIKNLHNDFERITQPRIPNNKLSRRTESNRQPAFFSSKILAGSGGSYAVLSLLNKK